MDEKGILAEVEDGIEAALKDPKGIAAHQRRLAFLLSLGMVACIEHYLTEKHVLKPGAKVDHAWLKRKRQTAKEHISRQITCPIENLEKIDILLNSAFEIEKDRNNIAYGKETSEKILKEKINLFLNMKKEVENV